MNAIYFRAGFLILTFLSAAAWAEPVVIDLAGAPENLSLGQSVDVLEDPDGKLTIEEISAARFGETIHPEGKKNTLAMLAELKAKGERAFVRSDMIRPSFGFSDSAYWFRIRLRQTQQLQEPPRPRLLEIGYTSLDYIWLFFPRTATEFWKFEGGDKYPFHLRQFNYKNVIFELPEFTGEKTVYLRIQSSGTADMPLFLQTYRSFASKAVNEQYAYGLYFGIMLVMVLYNLFIFLSTRDFGYLYYVLFITCNTLFQMNLRGYAFQYLWPNSIWWGHQSASFFLGTFSFFGLLFTRVFLNTKVTTPTLNKFVMSLMALEVIIVGASLIGLSHQIMARLMVIGGGLFIVLAALTGFRAFFKGFRPARYFMIAFSVYFLGGVVGALSRVVLPFNFFTEQADQIGFAIQVILLSLGLADRINTMKKEKEEAQAELLESRRVMLDSFARFVPKQFLNFLGRDSIVDVGLGDAVQKDFTVLFTDIRGFTTLSESMTANENFRFLNSYLKRMGPLIHLNGGFIDKFIGDAIMALFPENAQDALNAAIDMRRELTDYNAHRLSQGYEPVGMGIGLHSGGLMLGTVGSDSRLDTTVIGDTVNLASRLESMTKTFKLSIILSDAVFDLLPNKSQFHLREVDTVRVKGRGNPVVVYEAFDADEPHVLEKKIAAMPDFKEALLLYKAGDFGRAKILYDTMKTVCPEDNLVAMYSRRCEKLIESPPGPNWRGVSRMVMK